MERPGGVGLGVGGSAILLSEVRNDDSAAQLFGKPASVANNLLYQNLTATLKHGGAYTRLIEA